MDTVKKYIDLNRKFSFYDASSYVEQDDSTYYSRSLQATMTWDEVLKNKCSIVIAEAGSGKTEELKHITKVLRKQGKRAFLFDLATITKMNFDELVLTSGYQQEFSMWQQNCNEVGYFFLDSIDEARLTNHKDFESALRKFTAYINSQLQRVHIVITTRPTSWQTDADEDFIYQLFKPLLQENELELQLTSNSNVQYQTEEINQKIEIKKNETAGKSGIKIFQLAPLTWEQKEKYAQAMGVEDLKTFMDQLAQEGIEAYTARPQDLETQIVFWKTHKYFGKYHQVIERAIEIKLIEKNPNHQSVSKLTKDRVEDGVKKLAATVTLSKKVALLIPDESMMPSLNDIALDTTKVLTGWTNNEIKNLLSLPIFVKALNGTVRFHHRVEREYLAAKWLDDLLNNGKNQRSINKLLFDKTYGQLVIIPSMRPVAAWLAGFNSSVCEQIIKMDPTVLLEFGDPALFDIHRRSQLLEYFAIHYQSRDYTGFKLGTREVKRLADKDLKSKIIQLLNEYKNHTDIRKLLLRIVEQGQIRGCDEQLFEFVNLDASDTLTCAYAIRAIGVAGSHEGKKKLAKLILRNLKKCEPLHIEAMLEVLFPDYITIKNLISILEKIKKPNLHSLSNLSYQLNALPHLITAQESLQLLKGINRLLVVPPYKSKNEKFSTQYSWLLGFAFKLVERCLPDQYGKLDPAILSVLSFIRDGNDLGIDHTNCEVEESYNEFIANNNSLRHILFWYEIEQSESNEINTNYLIIKNKLAPNLDAEFFFKDIKIRSSFEEQIIALKVLFRFYIELNCAPEFLDKIITLIQGNSKLEDALQNFQTQYKQGLEEAEKYKVPESERESKKSKKLEERSMWIQSLKNCPEKINDPSNVAHIINLYLELRRLEKKEEHIHRLTCSHWELLESEFGRDVAKNFRDHCISFWRSYIPELRSHKKEPNSIPMQIMIGLSGIAMEARINPNWIANLTAVEVERAVRYALYELNEFPEWMELLTEKHPKDVKNILISEIKSEFLSSNGEFSYLIQRLRWNEKNVANHLQTDLVSILEALLNKPNFKLLYDILVIILRGETPLPKTFLQFVKKQYTKARKNNFKALWLSVWFIEEPISAIKKLDKWLSASNDTKDQEEKISAVLNNVFGDNRLKEKKDFLDITVLLPLIKIVFRYLRPENDVQHLGIYSPDARDNAVRIRGLLIELLSNIPGVETYKALHELSQFFESIKLHFLKDRMLFLAEQRAKADSEFSAWEPKDVADFANEAERFPKSEKDLFDIGISRLDDIKLDLEKGDESCANLLQKAENEPELRIYFADVLKKQAKKKYTVACEEEKADKSRTDIRLCYPHLISVPIELKIADNWTTSELLERLQNQLIGQYMLESKHGIFLLAHSGQKKSWQDSTKKKLKFDQLIEWLQNELKVILINTPSIQSIEIIGIDLTKRRCK